MNVVVLVGRITKDPEVKQTPNQKYFVNFSLAVKRDFRKDGQPEADFVSCIAFGKTAELIGKYIHKGSKFGVTGRIQTGSYQNQKGDTVYTTNVIVNSIEFLDSKGNSDNTQSNNSGNSAPYFEPSEGFIPYEDDVPF